MEEAEQWNAALPMSGQDFVSLPHKQEPELLGPLMRKGVRVLLGGASGEGKSTMAGYMTYSALACQDFCGFNGGPADLRATLLDIEMSPAQVTALVKRCRLDSMGSRFQVVNDPGGLALVPADTPLAKKQREWLEQIMEKTDILTLDPYYKTFRETGTPFDRVLTEEVLHILDELAKEYEVCLLIPSHARKLDSKYMMRADDIYGPSILQRNASVILGVQIVAYGKSRLFFFKDRFGDLPVRDHWILDFHKSTGYRVEARSMGEVNERDGKVAGTMLEAGRPLKMKEIAERLGITNTQVAKSLDTLRLSPDYIVEDSRTGQHRFYELHRRSDGLPPGEPEAGQEEMDV
jgi:biotin operon repressor